MQAPFAWPSDRSIPREWIEWGQQERAAMQLPPANLEITARDWVDHYSRDDRKFIKATEADWYRTWKIWVRRARASTRAQEEKSMSTNDMVRGREYECDEQISLARCRLAVRGIRSNFLDRTDIQRGIKAGILTEEQGRRLGY